MVTIVVMPTEANHLLDLLSSQSIYETSAFTSQDTDHVMVTGYIGTNECEDFCTELFHPDHFQGNEKVNAVIIQTSLFPKHDFVRILMMHN